MNFVEQNIGFWTAEKMLRKYGIPVKASHKILYLALFQLANQSGWKTYFSVPKKQGMELSGLSVNTYYRNLSDLENWGLIKIKHQHDKRKAPRIKLIKLVSKMILENEQLVSKMILASIKNDTSQASTSIKFETILKHKNKQSKQGEKIFFEGKKKNGNVLPPPTLQPIQA